MFRHAYLWMFHVLDSMLRSGVRLDSEHLQLTLLEHPFSRQKAKIEGLTKGLQSQIFCCIFGWRIKRVGNVPRFRPFDQRVLILVQRVAAFRGRRCYASFAHMMNRNDFIVGYWNREKLLYNKYYCPNDSVQISGEYCPVDVKHASICLTQKHWLFPKKHQVQNKAFQSNVNAKVPFLYYPSKLQLCNPSIMCGGWPITQATMAPIFLHFSM